MLVRDVMTTQVVTVTPKASLKHATELLDAHSITALPVVDGVVRLDGPTDEHVREIARVLASTVAGVVGVAFDS
jgi:CBS-domain-containing membrane protein